MAPLHQALRSPTGTTSVIADHTMTTTSEFGGRLWPPSTTAITPQLQRPPPITTPTAGCSATTTYIFFDVVGVNGGSDIQRSGKFKYWQDNLFNRGSTPTEAHNVIRKFVMSKVIFSLFFQTWLFLCKYFNILWSQNRSSTENRYRFWKFQKHKTKNHLIPNRALKTARFKMVFIP